MRTVLVCVRTPLAAQNVASAAARLGLSTAVRTAVSDPEVMLRLAERPADVVLADTALTRPDSVGFTRRVLARAPGAAILLFGAEEPGVASATIAAGARGLISSGIEHDLVSVVAKAMLLLAGPGRPIANRGAAGRASTGLPGAGGPGRGVLPSELGNPAGRSGPDQRSDVGARRPASPGAVAANGPNAGPHPGGPRANPNPGAHPNSNAGTQAGGKHPSPTSNPGPNGGAAAKAGPSAGPSSAGAAGTGPTLVPVQRGDDVADENEAAAPGGEPHAAGGSEPRTGGNAAPDARFAGPRRGDPANTNGYGRDGTGAAGRQVALTEREMQVLLGMAEGKSNAEIGRELFVSEDTVKTHARRLFRKLGARDRAHAVAAGFRAGLVA